MTVSVYLKCKNCGALSQSGYVPPVVAEIQDGAIVEVEKAASDVTVDEYFTKYYFWPRCECGSRSYAAEISESAPDWFE
ncbi:hypothetical protein [Raoultella ornithinolytica]|uniref:hypothetical protein n=1 Tax=Raoultella ornithinolytica TaxID=54291 RepID=UPI001F2D6632|nr:hypothetical protein [Raoultella ornithinolytica]MCF6687065.1 hypothetical protein [Raoultella ornithinolytica]